MIMGDADNDEEHEKAAFQVTGLQGLKYVAGGSLAAISNMLG